MEFDSSRMDTRHSELTRIFGEGVAKLVAQVSHDNHSLNEQEVIDYAWSLIPEATAYMMPAYPEDLTENAIRIHEEYEALRRTQD